MKTKLTLNIDDRIIVRAKRISAKKKVSLSSLVEDYLDRLSKKEKLVKNLSEEPSLLERIQKYTKDAVISDESDYKKIWHQHLDDKYGK